MLQGGWIDWKAFLCMSDQQPDTPSHGALCSGSSSWCSCRTGCRVPNATARPTTAILPSATPTPCQSETLARKRIWDLPLMQSFHTLTSWGEAFCTLLPSLHNRRRRLRKSWAGATVRYLKVMTNIWRFVLQGLTHLYKFWVRLPGVSPVASKELYLFTLAKNLALYFLICPHLSPPPVVLVLPGLFFGINTPSSGWLLH